MENSNPSKYKVAKDTEKPARIYNCVALSCAKSNRNGLIQFCRGINTRSLSYFFLKAHRQTKSRNTIRPTEGPQTFQVQNAWFQSRCAFWGLDNNRSHLWVQKNEILGPEMDKSNRQKNAVPYILRTTKLLEEVATMNGP